MFRATSNTDLIFLFIDEANGIAHQISPGSGISTYYNGVVLILLYILHHQYFGLFNNISFGVKIIIVERNKLHEDIIVQDEMHALRMLPVLEGDEPFACEVIFNIHNRLAQQLLKSFLIGFESHPSVHKESKVRPDLMDVVQMIM